MHLKIEIVTYLNSQDNFTIVTVKVMRIMGPKYGVTDQRKFRDFGAGRPSSHQTPNSQFPQSCVGILER